MESFSVVIPTLNEEENIGEVIDGIREHGDPEIIVVDDSSTDRTREMARERGARVIEREGKRDLSSSIVLGIREATREKVIVIDGDGQHPPSKIPDVLEGLEELDLVIVSRRKVEGRWMLHRRMISFFSRLIAKALFRNCREVVEPISGFFGIRKESLDLDRLRPRGYKVLVEILVTHDLEVGETMYVFRQREDGESALGPRVILEFLLNVIDLKYRQVSDRI